MTWKGALAVVLIALSVLSLGYCKAHGAEVPRVVIEFRTSREIAEAQNKSPNREQYRAKALTFYRPNNVVIWLPIDRPVDLELLGHEWRHARGERHDSMGRWIKE